MDRDGRAALPLDGVRIVDLTRNVAGPYCTMMLGDMGAEVIKVEPPGVGDELRQLYRLPGRAPDTEDVFGLFNRNKRSLVLDLKSERGRQILWELLAKSDVFIQNLAPGAVDRLGFGWDAVHAHNRRLVYVAISGFGPDDPRRAYDGVVQAASGMMDMTGAADGPPVLCGFPVADMSAALFAAFATVNAVLLAMKTGTGACVDIAMLDCLLALHYGVAAEYLATGKVSTRMGAEASLRVPYNAYATADDRFVFLVANDLIWPRLCRALALEPMIDDPRFNNNQGRTRHRDLVNAAIAERVRQLPMAEVAERLEAAGVPQSPILNLAEALSSEYVARREMVRSIDGAQRDGREPIRVMGMPYKMSPFSPRVRHGPPALGEANAYVLHEVLGLTDTDIDTSIVDGGVRHA